MKCVCVCGGSCAWKRRCGVQRERIWSVDRDEYWVSEVSGGRKLGTQAEKQKSYIEVRRGERQSGG